MKESDRQEIRQIFREELRAALGVDQTDVAKLADLPLVERQAFFKGRRLEQKKTGARSQGGAR